MARVSDLQIVYRKTAELIPYARNSRTHSDAQVKQIAASIEEFGFTNPVLIDERDGIIAGHGRVMAAELRKLAEVPTITLAGLTEAQKRAYVIADNRLPLNAGWDEQMLAVELDDLRDMDFDLSLLGFSPQELNDLIGTPNEPPEQQPEASGAGSLADRFMIPPFSVLNAREGWWQDRKRAWLALGIKSEEGRGAETFNQESLDVTRSKKANAAPGGSNMVAGYDADGNRTVGMVAESGTSIFDPVLCELSYRWFSPAGGVVLDPFAGGSVRGIVASRLGRRYIGHELRPEQVAANRAQGDELCGDLEHPPIWIEGDSRGIDRTCADVHADMIFSCPPYADLEVYSDNPQDLSTLGYEEFRAAYFEIIKKACARLKKDRFACFVVGEVRDKKGNYYDFVGDTVQAFRDAGLAYYNEAILVTAVGSLPIRAGKQFSASRKFGKTHQNVLVFVKGDGKKAAAACGEVEVSDDCLQAVAGDEGGAAGSD